MDITAVLAILDPDGKGGRRYADEIANAVRDLEGYSGGPVG